MSAEESISNVLSCALARKHKPRSDLMSKWILSDKQVINLVVRETIGEHALDQYQSRPAEWPNGTKSDVLYTTTAPKSSASLPPVLVEIQYTANMAFYRRLIDYSLSVMKQYARLPIVLAVVIHNTTKDLMELTSVKESIPFLLQLPCSGWADACYILNAASVSTSLDHTPLNPLVALGHFFIQQKLSLRDISRNADVTIQLLYAIASRMFGDNIQQNTPTITLEQLHEIQGQCAKAKACLIEDVRDVESRKRTLGCLDDILQFIDAHPAKRAIVTSSSNSTSVIDTNQDWAFVDNYRQEHGSLNWDVIFELGKDKGLFGSYSKWSSAKAAYYRFKKEKKTTDC